MEAWKRVRLSLASHHDHHSSLNTAHEQHDVRQQQGVMRVPFLTPLQALRAPVQGFDALRVLAQVSWLSTLARSKLTPIHPQILALQSLHYLLLALLLPITLSLLASPAPLTFQGGPANLSPLLDWRELLGTPTFSPSSDWADVWLSPTAAHPSSDAYPTPQGPFQHVDVLDVTRPVPGMSLKESQVSQAPPRDGEWDLRGKDEMRKWAIWLAWAVAAVAE